MAVHTKASSASVLLQSCKVLFLQPRVPAVPCTVHISGADTGSHHSQPAAGICAGLRWALPPGLRFMLDGMDAYHHLVAITQCPVWPMARLSCCDAQSSGTSLWPESLSFACSPNPDLPAVQRLPAALLCHATGMEVAEQVLPMLSLQPPIFCACLLFKVMTLHVSMSAGCRPPLGSSMPLAPASWVTISQR